MPDVNSVFTPTGSLQSNKDMYISRSKIEKELMDLLNVEGRHILIHGESGYGKTWFYQYVLDELRKKYILIDSSVVMLDGFKGAFENVLSDKGEFRLSGLTNQVGSNIPIVEASRNKEYEYYESTSFEQLLKLMQKNRETVLVFDNLEILFDNNELVKQLLSIISSNLLNLYSIKLLLVGVQVHEKLLNRTQQQEIITRRLSPIQVTSQLDNSQVAHFVKKGFGKLGINLPDYVLNNLSRHVHYVTFGVPHALHEYCRQVANNYIQGKNDTDIIISDSNKTYKQWVENLLGSSKNFIKNIIEANAPQQHRILYTLGCIESDIFTNNERVIASKLGE